MRWSAMCLSVEGEAMALAWCDTAQRAQGELREGGRLCVEGEHEDTGVVR